jgi:hypothetical protein
MTNDAHEQPRAARSAIGARPLVLAGALAVVAGVGAILLAWYHMGNTSQVWVQNQELASGGLLGLGLIIVGSALLVRDSVLRAVELRTSNEPAAAPAIVEPAVNGKRRATRVKETV